MPQAPTTTSRAKIGAAAGLAGAAAVFALVVGVGPAPSVFQLASANEDISGSCDEAEHASDPECQGVVAPSGDSTTSTHDAGTSTTVDDSTSTTAGGGGAATADEVRSVDAAGAGIVVYAFEDGRFRLISATPAAGWRVDVEQSAGDEIDLDFRSGSQRVQVDIEVEDGRVRERVRFRDDATDERIEIEDGVVQDDSSGHGGDDDSSNSGPGSGDDDSDDNSGSGSHDDDDDDRSGSNSGSG